MAGGSVPVTDIPTPSDLPHAKLGRKKRTANKTTTIAGVAMGLDALFSFEKYRRGEGYEFWGLTDAEKTDLATKVVACLDALPSGKANKFVQWMVSQIEQYAPFGALAWAGYTTLAWRIELTRQVTAAKQGVPRATGNHGEGAGSPSNSASGGVDTTGRGVPAESGNDHPAGGDGIGVAGKPNGSVTQLFAPPPHITA